MIEMERIKPETIDSMLLIAKKEDIPIMLKHFLMFSEDPYFNIICRKYGIITVIDLDDVLNDVMTKILYLKSSRVGQELALKMFGRLGYSSLKTAYFSRGNYDQK